jgi:transposase InsO family protein
VWHVDGYMKLAQFGVEVYAAIDGYSRYILWIYVGISTRTAVSVLAQFLDTLADLSYQPEIIRSDLGSETSLIGDAQWALRQVFNPEAAHGDCFWLGRSTDNQRIEAWWAQLSKSCTFLYYHYFRELQEQGKLSCTLSAAGANPL